MAVFGFALVMTLVLPATAETVADAQKEAVERYPDLGDEGSPIHAKFLELYQNAQKTEPSLFSNVDWPVIIADRAYALLAATPTPSPTATPSGAGPVATGTTGNIPSLSDADKARIRAEEIFRHEIDKEIETSEQADSDGRQIWTILNSSFTLWFLSSVVVASLTAAVALFQKRHGERVRRAETQRRLDIEISSRIAGGLVALNLEKDRIAAGSTVSISWIFNEALYYLNNRVTDGHKQYDFSIFPEYKARGFQSLIFELSSVVNPSIIAALRESRTIYTQLEALADHAAIEASSEKPPATDKHLVLGALSKTIDLLNKLESNSFWRPQL